MESEFDGKLAAVRKFARSLFLKKVEGKFLFFSLLPAEIRLTICKITTAAHPHPRVHTLLYGLVTGAIIPKTYGSATTSTGSPTLRLGTTSQLKPTAHFFKPVEMYAT
jgi:hypothetical protein